LRNRRTRTRRTYEDALFETGPFAEPAADDTRLQFQLRALETPFGLAYLGIIDILTQYGVAKVAENLCFGTLMCGADISCQPPDRYARRFKRFIDAHVLKVGPETEGDKERGPIEAPLEIEASGEPGTK
jgi:1-phosphatidylinositol-4-phosphate 5-kinase